MIVQTLFSTVYNRVRLNAVTRTLRRIALCSLMISLTVGLFRPAEAQPETPKLAQAADTMNASAPTTSASPASFAIASPTWRSNFDAQAAHMLREEDSPATRSIVLGDVIVVATQHPNAIDLSATAGALLQICESDPDKQRRLMAIQALHAIGTEHAGDRRYRRAMKHLHRIMQDEPSTQVRNVAASALHDFFGTGEET